MPAARDWVAKYFATSGKWVDDGQRLVIREGEISYVSYW